MRINKEYGFPCFLSFALIILSNQGISQKIDFRLSSIDSLDVSSVSEVIKDINGDTCSIINLDTDLDSIKFYSNLGVERVQKNESGYKVWVPSRSGSIKLIIPRFPLSEYIIPASSYKYSVYNLELAVSELQNIVYTDTVKPVLSFMVSPDRSRIIINGKFAGRSPYIVQNPEFFDFDYKIKRRGYETYVSRDSFDVRIKSIPVTMNSSYKSKRFFLTITIGTDGGVYGDNNVLLNELDYWPMYGMTFGIFGRTGIYGSAGFTSKNINNYWVRGIVNKVRLAAGVSQQFGKSMFIYFGPGCTTRKYSFDDYTSTWKDESRTTVDLNTGLIFRIGWYSLLQIDYSKGLNEPYMAIGIGLGINLPKKSK